MKHSHGDGGAVAFRRGAGLLVMVLLVTGNPAARAGLWTWTGLGNDDSWSTTNNWSPAGPPASDNATTLIFGGCNRLTPEQDLRDAFQFGGLAFTTNAGAFCLGGTSNAFGQPGWRSLQFSGSNTSITVLGGDNVAICGALVTPASGATQTITVATGMTLQVPWIKGGLRRVVVKKGSGMLRVYEHADGQHYLERSATVAPEYRVEEGVVEMGTRTNRHVLASDGTGWKADPAEVKASYNLTIGDGVGSATSAVFRLIGPAQTQLIDNNLAITVNADGLLDLNGVQNWDPDNPLSLAISNGLVRLGGSTLDLRNGHTLDLRGSARIEGVGASAIRLYDGATNFVDSGATRATLAADAALVSATNNAGIVFQVNGALDVIGHLGAGGAGSHLVKRGAGTLAISNLTHAARTNRVEEGVLLLRGVSRCAALSGAAQWVVSATATLGGSGIISNAAVVAQGGTLAPGSGAVAGVFTIESDLTLAPGSALEIDLAPADPVTGRMHDQLVLQKGVLTGLTNAALRVTLHDRPGVDDQTFRIVSGGGDLAGQSFCAVTLTGRYGRYAEVSTGNGYVDLTIRSKLVGTGVFLR